jgi:naphthalene 1,2-dioxygenase ferredoxin component
MGDRQWIDAIGRDALIEGDVVAADVQGREIAIYLVEGTAYATDNLCTHGNARLSEGFVLGDCVECPLHQGQFDIRSGMPLCPPVTEPLRIYPTRIVGERVEVAIEDASAVER